MLDELKSISSHSDSNLRQVNSDNSYSFANNIPQFTSYSVFTTHMVVKEREKSLEMLWQAHNCTIEILAGWILFFLRKKVSFSLPLPQTIVWLYSDIGLVTALGHMVCSTAGNGI